MQPHERKRPISRDERLSELIRLKRLERPDAQFWERFEQGFRSKQLASLVRVHPWHERVGRALFLAAKKAAPATAATCALAVTFFAVSRPDLIGSKEAEPAAQPELAQDASAPRFSVDAASADALDTELQPFAPATNALEYQVRVLSKTYSDPNYELRADPMTLQTAPQEGEDEELGAKVIKGGHSF